MISGGNVLLQLLVVICPLLEVFCGMLRDRTAHLTCIIFLYSKYLLSRSVHLDPRDIRTYIHNVGEVQYKLDRATTVTDTVTKRVISTLNLFGCSAMY